MTKKKVVIAGGGVLGTQIAFQAYLKGDYDTTIWLRSEGSIERSKPKLQRLKEVYFKEAQGLKANIGNESYPYPHGLVDDFSKYTEEDADKLIEKVENVERDLKVSLDTEKTFSEADIIVEAISENPEVKIDFYKKVYDLVRKDALLLTNSSSLLPSQFAEYTPNPERYLALHFANSIWRNNTGEVMGHPGTAKEAVDETVAFAEKIGMVPLVLHKEQPAYLLNSLLIPFLNSATLLLANEVSDAETIDKAWELGTGAPIGPFKILDIVGLKTAYDIALMSPGADDPTTDAGKICALYKSYLDQGKGGLNFGEGFYKYK